MPKSSWLRHITGFITKKDEKVQPLTVQNKAKTLVTASVEYRFKLIFMQMFKKKLQATFHLLLLVAFFSACCFSMLFDVFAKGTYQYNLFCQNTKPLKFKTSIQYNKDMAWYKLA